MVFHVRLAWSQVCIRVCFFSGEPTLVMMCFFGHITPQVLQKTMELLMVDLDARAADRLDTSGMCCLTFSDMTDAITNDDSVLKHLQTIP